MNDKDYKDCVHQVPNSLPTRQSVSGEITETLKALDVRATVIANTITERLSCIARDQYQDSNNIAEEKLQEYPPLFSIYRDYILGVNSSLSRIEEVLAHLELP
jgi:hypothetical protein